MGCVSSQSKQHNNRLQRAGQQPQDGYNVGVTATGQTATGMTATGVTASYQSLEEILLKRQWQAGKGKNSGEESYSKNPWVFKSDNTFMTLRDKHHGTWKIESSNKQVLKLTWTSTNGYADFELIQTNKSDKPSLKCINCGWGFMKSWTLIFLQGSDKISSNSSIVEVEQFIALNQWQAGKEITGDESYQKNPWGFFENKYFGTLRDEHHGEWQMINKGEKTILKLKWKSCDGNAEFELLHYNSNGQYGEPNFKCIQSGWGFMRSWNIKLQPKLDGLDVNQVEQMMISNEWYAGKDANSPGQKYNENPWAFKADKTFKTLKDNHGGNWRVDKQGDRIYVRLRWTTVDGFADFQVNHNKRTSAPTDTPNLNCAGSGWGFMRSWNLLIK